MKVSFQKILAIAIPVVLVMILWLTDEVRPNQLLSDVSKAGQIKYLETPYLYAYLHLFCLLPVFLLSFDRKVQYYSSWKYLFPAIAIVGTIFILWDAFFTKIGVWGFNPDYFIGIKWLELPLEEWLFFCTVPFAVVFIYECLNAYVKKDWLAGVDKTLSLILVGLFFGIGIWSWGQLYTTTTFLLSGAFVLYHYCFIPNTYRSRVFLKNLISWLPFLLINGVLTGGFTESPVVLYNPDEYLGIRIISIPLDDAVYSFLLLFGTISWMEFFRAKAA